MENSGCGSVGDEDGVGLLQDARHQRPGNNPRRGHQQETRASAHNGGDLSHTTLQPFNTKVNR